ncbi:MAG: NUDIX hydrolase [bacterium]
MSIPQTRKSEFRYKGKVFNLIVDEVEFPSGAVGIHEIADHPGGAVIVPMIDDDHILLVKQYRYAVKRVVYELPAGKLEPGEQPEACAARELEEETGYRAATLHRLISVYTTPGFCNEILHIFLATGLQLVPQGQDLEEGEIGMTVERMPLRQAVEMIFREEIIDSKTICGIFLTQRTLAQTRIDP